MSNTDIHASLGDCRDAKAVCERWVALAESRPATVERAVLLVSMAKEIATGYAALVIGDRRAGLIARISGVIASWDVKASDPVEARRAAWAVRQAAGLGVPDTRFAVRVVPHDPNPVSIPVETRIRRRPRCITPDGSGRDTCSLPLPDWLYATMAKLA